MANFITDTSVVMKHVLNEEFTENADRLFDQLGDGISLYIPGFCLVECTNVLWTRVRFDSMPEGEALILLEDLANLPFAITSIEDLLPRALQIGLEHQLPSLRLGLHRPRREIQLSAHQRRRQADSGGENGRRYAQADH